MHRGWMIYGDRDSWAAYRFDVRMRANSLELIRTMIDLSEEGDKNGRDQNLPG